MQLEQTIFISFGYWVVEASALVLLVFNSINGILESTDFIPESSQDAKAQDDYSEKKLK